MAKAKELLREIPPATVDAMQSKQVSMTILAKETEMIKNMMNEGLLSSKRAQMFLNLIIDDTVKVERSRENIYQLVSFDFIFKYLRLIKNLMYLIVGQILQLAPIGIYRICLQSSSHPLHHQWHLDNRLSLHQLDFFPDFRCHPSTPVR